MNPHGSPPSPGDTIEYYDTDGTTVLASGTVDSVSGNYTFLTDSGTGQFVVPRNRNAISVNFKVGIVHQHHIIIILLLSSAANVCRNVK